MYQVYTIPIGTWYLYYTCQVLPCIGKKINKKKFSQLLGEVKSQANKQKKKVYQLYNFKMIRPTEQILR